MDLQRRLLLPLPSAYPELMSHLVLYYNPRRQSHSILGRAPEVSTNALEDLSGNEHHMKLYGNPGFVKVGSDDCALYFQGSANNVQYGLVNNLPELTKENGFTIVCSRLIESYNDTYNNNMRNGCIASKREGWSNAAKTAFVFEAMINNAQRIDSFDERNNITGIKYNYSGWSYMTSNKYVTFDSDGNKQEQSLAQGDAPDSTVLYINYPGDLYSMSFYLYSFILFDRDLTDKEVQWVKDNMVDYIPQEQIVEPPSDEFLIDKICLYSRRNDSSNLSTTGITLLWRFDRIANYKDIFMGLASSGQSVAYTPTYYGNYELQPTNQYIKYTVRNDTTSIRVNVRGEYSESDAEIGIIEQSGYITIPVANLINLQQVDCEFDLQNLTYWCFEEDIYDMDSIESIKAWLGKNTSNYNLNIEFILK